MSPTCKRCGATYSPEDAAFCGSCGAPRSPASPAAEGPEGAPDAPPHGTLPGEPVPAAVDPAGGAPATPPRPAPPAGAPREKPVMPPRHLATGTLIDKKYAVLRVLGEGGMGVVYLARDIHTGLDVVVKAVKSELSHREDVRARTLAEGRALAQIDHPNVVHLRAVAVDGPNLFLVMQYIEGESLDRIIAGHAERGEPMPVEDALGVLRQVAAGVGAAHEEGVIHRDLKPANVLLRKKDRVAKVTDFGIALVPSDTSRPETRGILGSLWYMSPEQVTGQRDLDLRVDVYALGIMLYQMLVGRVPFDAKSDYEIMKLHAEAPMPLAAAARPDVPAPVDDIIQKACAKDRDQRFERCEELVAAVDRLLGFATAPRSLTPYPTLVPAITQLAPAPLVHDGPKPPGDDGRAVRDPAPAPPGDGGSLDGEAAPEPPGGSDEGSALPVRRGWGLGLVLVLLLVGGGVATAVGTGLVPVGKRPRAPASAEPAPPRASASPDAGRPALEALAGTWVGNGHELTAVVAGGDLEFRVKKPEQFAPQNYEAGEARFVLHATADASVYTVEDRIRPVPPQGKSYDARARGTCQEVWTAVGSDPLRARHDGARLSVEFAKIEPGPANFTIEGGKVTSCVGLRKLRASKVVSVLTRP